MKKYNRLLAFSLVLILFMFAFSACGQEKASESVSESGEKETETVAPTDSAIESESESATTQQVPTESASESMSAEVPTESASENMSAQVPTESASENMSAQVPTESASESTSAEVPTESASESTSAEVPTESASESTSAEVPTESASESTSAEVPTESVSESMSAEVPTESASESMSAEVPTESASESASTDTSGPTIMPSESGTEEENLILDEKEYCSQTVEVPYAQYVTDKEVDEVIMEVLFAYGTPHDVVDRAAIEGDTVNIYYKGVITDEGGKETAFDGGTYMTFGNPYPLTLGSGQFIDGFEDGLIGVIPQNTFRFVSEDDTLTVAPDSVIRVTYEATYDDHGTVKTKSGEDVIIDLEKQTFGDAFATALVGAKVGETRTFDTSYDINSDKTNDTVSMTVTVSEIAVLNACEVMATFPDSYPSAPDLAGKTVKFYVWVESITETVPAELNETFITETLMFDVKEGEDAVASLKNYIKEELQAQRDADVKEEVLDAIWSNMLEKAVFKKFPQDKADTYYEEEMEMLELYFNYYGAYYGCKTIEEFAPLYFGEPVADLETYVRSFVEDLVKQELIQEHLCQKYSLAVDEETLAEEVEKFFQEEADYANSLDPSANYTAESIRKELESIYGVGYFEGYVAESLNRERLNAFLLSNCTVSYSEE